MWQDCETRIPLKINRKNDKWVFLTKCYVILTLWWLYLCFSDLTSAIDDETILFVMGDHGMTISGDHGGDSKDEVMAGLFVYSKKRLFTISVSFYCEL